MTEYVDNPHLFPRTHDLPFSTISISWCDAQSQHHLIYSELLNTLHNQIHTQQYRQYLNHKGKFTPYQSSRIDWLSRSKAHSNMTLATNRWTTKWLTGFCGIGTMLVIYKHQKHSKCPRCNCDNETLTHVLKCSAPTAQQLWDDEMTNLQQWILDNKGCPLLAETIVTQLHAWHNNELPPQPSSSSPLLLESIWQQASIGWQSFIEGFWSSKWREHQLQYFESI